MENTQPANKISLIIDTNAFIQCLDLNELSKKYVLYTTYSAYDEIRDKKAREKFQTLTCEIQTIDPSLTSLKFVKNFAKQTGDFKSLSETDFDIIAIAYTLAENAKKLDLLRKQPAELTEFVSEQTNVENQVESEVVNLEAKENQQTQTLQANGSIIQQNNNQEQEQIENEENQQDNDGWITTKPKKNRKQEQYQQQQELQNKILQQQLIKKEEELQQQIQSKIQQQEEQIQNEQKNNEENEENLEVQVDEDEDEDDGEGWINATNLTKYLHNSSENVELEENKLGIAIMTTDYAMQNVILQIGIPLISFDDRIIKRTKRFVLECYACKRICKIMDKQFCPTCGNHTLLKLSCQVNDDGTMTFFRKKNFKVITKGNQFNIPKQKFGRHAQNLLLREDEFIMNGRDIKQRELEREKEKNYKNAMFDFEHGFEFKQVQSKKIQQKRLQYGYGRTNPNDVNAMKHKKKN